jgi:soluble lytic murein transglycosylase-like protein
MLETKQRAGIRRKPAALLALAVGLVWATPAWSAEPLPKKATSPAEARFATIQTRLNDAADEVLAQLSASGGAEDASLKGVEANKAVAPEQSPANNLRQNVERVKQLRTTWEPILREEGLPANLAAVALMESGGQAAALSPKGARGLWQLMPETARRYGLTVNQDRDERLDVRKSTRAAAQYLRELYARFGDWPLALAAYNAGEQRVQRALDRAGRGDFLRISRWLPSETRQYVPAVMNSRWLFTGGPARSPDRGQPVVYAPAGD